nr:tetratricopeptide repeat protein [Rhodovastum atsumiense]
MLLLLAGTGGAAWWWYATPPAPEPDVDATAPLPLPPVPPMLAEGERYGQCLAMLAEDPSGALSLAEAWTDGGEAAAHCRAMAEVALGNAATGAALLQEVADASKAPAGPRAAVFGQAEEAWLMAGSPARAFEAATRGLALSPDDPDLLVGHARAASALERFDLAAGDLTRALATDPRRPEALVLRAAALRQLGRLEEAEADIRQAVALDPDSAEALLERGILRQLHADLAGAQADWEHVIELAPDTTTADLAEQNLALLAAGPAR